MSQPRGTPLSDRQVIITALAACALIVLGYVAGRFDGKAVLIGLAGAVLGYVAGRFDGYASAERNLPSVLCTCGECPGP